MPHLHPMSSSPISGSPPPVRPRPALPAEHALHPGEQPPPHPAAEISAAEREFFIAEFRDVTIVVAVPELSSDAVDPLARTVREFAPGGTRLVLVVSSHADADRLVSAHPEFAVVDSPTVWQDQALVDLWITTTDARAIVVVAAEPDGVAETAGFVAAGLGASKVVFTDPGGGWGSPPKSFVDLTLHRDALGEALRARGIAHVLAAAETALRGGAYSVNLCRAEDLERELFTFDGAGTLLTLGGYVRITRLRVDDLPAVEKLVAQGVADGILKPRTRAQVAGMAIGGLGARVVRTGHLAGIVGLETDAYGREGLGEISGLVTVSEFSGAGSGGLLVEGTLERAAREGLRALFAVTVSDDAAAFFLRRGFREVSREDVPPAKWAGYDPERLARARCFWRDVVPTR